MDANFIYNVPTKVYFGENQLCHLAEELKKFGNKVLLTYGGGSIKKSGLYDNVVNEIKRAGMELFELSGIEPNPRIDSVREGATICKDNKIDVLLAVGGGSTIDCTKYIGAATYYDGDAWDLLTKDVNVDKCVPIVTILTLSATGSEMNSGGVISNPETNDKIGHLYPCMLPKVSFLDPTNTYSVNPYQTACGSADILSHVIEVYFNMSNDLEMLDYFMEGLMKTVIKYAPIAIKDPTNYDARANLMWASSWAINGYIKASKKHAWSCHPMEHELSAIYDITHGLGLAILTPRWMEYCLDDTNISKYVRFGINVFGIDATLPDEVIANKAIGNLKEFLFTTLDLKSTFTEIDIDDKNFKIMATKAEKLGGTKNSFKPLYANDIENIYKMCL